MEKSDGRAGNRFMNALLTSLAAEILFFDLYVTVTVTVNHSQ